MHTSPVSDYLPTKEDSAASDPKAETTIKKQPYDLRRQVCLAYDDKLKLTSFARLLFCRLTDMAKEPQFKRGEGILECSKKFLADDFHVSVDTITRATRLLEAAGFLWTVNTWTGSFELTWWFIREWANDEKEFPRHTAGTFGRRRRGVQRNTERDQRGKFLRNPNSIRSQFRAWQAQQSTVKAGISPDHGQESALTAPTNQPSPGAKPNPDHGQQSALTGQTNQPSPGAAASPDQADESARTGRNGRPGQGAKMPGIATPETSRETETLPKRVATRAKGGVSRHVPFEERHFMDLCREVFGVQEMDGPLPGKPAGNGGLWRTIFQEYPAKALACVNEAKICKTTRPSTLNKGSTWAAFAMDLWKSDRLSYGKKSKPPSSKPVPRAPLPAGKLPTKEKWSEGVKALRGAVEAAK